MIFGKILLNDRHMKKILFLLFLFFVSISVLNAEEKIMDYSLLKITDFNGKELILKDVVKNQELIIISFFTSWCYYCKLEVPDLNSIIKQFATKKVKVIGLAYDEDSVQIKSFIKEYKPKYAIYFLNSSDLNKYMRISGFPTSIFLNSKYQLIDTLMGYHDDKFLKEFINKKLK